MTRRAISLGLLVWTCGWAAPALLQPARADDLSPRELGERLKTGDADAKLATIAKLEELGAEAKPAVAALAETLKNADPKVRYHAARALGAIGPDAAAAVPALVAKLKDTDPLVRAHSVRTLGLIGEPSKRHVKEIAVLITDKDEKVRREVPHAFLRMKPDRSVTIPLFTKILQDGDPTVRNMVLHAVADTGADAVPFLLDALERPESRYWACLALGQVGPDAAKAVPKLLEIAEDKEAEQRMEAIMALGSIKPSDAKTIAAIAAHFEDPFGGAQFAAAYALGNIGPAAKSSGAALTKQVRNARNEFLKVTSAWALARIYAGDERILASSLSILVDGAKSRDPNVRAAAAKSLGELKAKPTTSLPALIGLLGDAEKAVVAQAIEGVAKFGAEAVPLTGKALVNDRLRLGAVVALKRIGPPAKDAVPELVQAMSKEQNVDVRREIFFALAAIGSSEEAIPELIKSLSHENVKVRNGATYALGKIGPPAKSALPTLKRNMSSTDDEYLPMLSAWAAAQIDYENPETVRQTMPVFIKGLSHREMLVRLEAAKTLGLFGPRAKQAAPALKSALQDKDPYVREAVAAALKKVEGE